MKILVTGAAGFVGSRLVKSLTAMRHQVIAIVRPGNSKEGMERSSGVELLPLDLSDLDCQKLPDSIDAVVTLVQSSRFREFPEFSDDIYSVNVTANFRLFDWASKHGVSKFIHVSSGGIYGGSQDQISYEKDALALNAPLGFYQGSKVCAEIIFQNYQTYFDTSVILRPFFIYGPFQRKDMLIRRIVESVRTGTPITLQGESGLKINPVYVDDVVSAISASLELPGHQVMNLAGPDVLTLKQIAETVGQRLGKKPVFEIKEGTPLDYIGNTKHASDLLNLGSTGFQEGIEKTLRLEGLLP